MIFNKDGTLNFKQIENMSVKEIESECAKYEESDNMLLEEVGNVATIPLEGMRKFAKIIFLKKQKEKYGHNF